jgi:hypothetical protein
VESRAEVLSVQHRGSHWLPLPDRPENAE